MSVLSGALGHVLWRDGEAAEAKLFPVRVTAVDEITATFDCEYLAYRGSSSKDLPFDTTASSSMIPTDTLGWGQLRECSQLSRPSRPSRPGFRSTGSTRMGMS